MDDGWQDLEYWERVAWSRSQRFETAVSAAESMGMKPDTYRAYERRPDSSKHTRLDHQAAARFAKKFGVRWEWLLTGEGLPINAPAGADGPGNNQPPTPAQRIVVVLRDVSLDRQEAIADAVEALVKAGRGER